MQKFADMGLDVAITELDVRLLEPENKTNLATQSEVYKNTTGACMLLDACVGITVWDFYDPVSLPCFLACGIWGGVRLIKDSSPGSRVCSRGMGLGLFGFRISLSTRLMMGLCGP